MDIQILTELLMWCTIINGGLFALWAVLWLLVPDWVYRSQERWCPIPRETYNIVMYAFLGFFKIVFLVFNVVPYVALLIVG